jgi:hypothetical protein
LETALAQEGTASNNALVDLPTYDRSGHGPLATFVALFFTAVAMVLGLIAIGAFLLLCACLAVSTAPLHVALRAAGRRGFLTYEKGSRFSYRVGVNGFRRHSRRLSDTPPSDPA